MEKMIVGNLKMNILSATERDNYLENFKKELKLAAIKKSALVLCVPQIHLETFGKKLKSKLVKIGAQNIFWEEKGSFTGETSPQMAKNFGAEFTIIGHSERRKYFSETNENCNLKIKAAVKSKLLPIYCVGETREEKDAGNAAQVIIEQITEGFSGLSATQAQQIIVAYEPVWAVGSDAIPTSNEILEVRILLKKIFAEMYGISVAEKMRVLYGGSVKAETLNQVCFEPDMDGVLVGRESLIPRDFLKIVSAIEKGNM